MQYATIWMQYGLELEALDGALWQLGSAFLEKDYRNHGKEMCF